jgi:hypothetical protein
VPFDLLDALDELERRKAILRFRSISFGGGYTSDLTLRLHLVTCSVPIYLSSKFQGIWRPPSSGSKF